MLNHFKLVKTSTVETTIEADLFRTVDGM